MTEILFRLEDSWISNVKIDRQGQHIFWRILEIREGIDNASGLKQFINGILCIGHDSEEFKIFFLLGVGFFLSYYLLLSCSSNDGDINNKKNCWHSLSVHQVVGTSLSPLQAFLYSKLATALQIKYFNHTHFMDKETERKSIKVK